MTVSLVTPDAWSRVGQGYTSRFTPTLAAYARTALSLAQPAADAHVLDVAAGPGTLALLAAPDVRHVSALDFSSGMIDRLRHDAAARGLTNVEAVVGDGQALPYADASFDAAFSMFGLIFFPDRARGLGELLRVLWQGPVEANVLFAGVLHGMSAPARDQVAERVLHGLRANLGDGEVRYLQTAIFGVGARPEGVP